MVVDFWSLLLLFGCLQGVFLMSILLFHPGGNRQAKQLLAVLIGVISLQLFTYLVVSTDLYRKFPHLTNSGIPLLFLIGPLYYGYVKSLLEDSFKWKVCDLAHAIPVLPAAFYFLSFYSFPAEQKIEVIEYMKSQAVVEVPFDVVLFVGVHTIQTGIYIWLALHLIKKYQNGAGALLTNGMRVKSKWLKQFSNVFLGYWVLVFLNLILLDFFDRFAHEIDYVVFLGMTAIIGVIGFAAVRESGIFSGGLSMPSIKKYQNSPISPQEAKRLADRLKDVMEQKRLYLHNELSLTDLAEKLSISSNHLSQIINQELDSNFYDFINNYRVREAMDRLKKPSSRHLTILAIAYEVGFNNKNSFNKAFKKVTGRTPSEYMKLHQETTQ